MDGLASDPEPPPPPSPNHAGAVAAPKSEPPPGWAPRNLSYAERWRSAGPGPCRSPRRTPFVARTVSSAPPRGSPGARRSGGYRRPRMKKLALPRRLDAPDVNDALPSNSLRTWGCSARGSAAERLTLARAGPAAATAAPRTFGRIPVLERAGRNRRAGKGRRSGNPNRAGRDARNTRPFVGPGAETRATQPPR